MRTVLALAAGWLAAAPGAFAANAQQLIERSIQALGGAEALSGLKRVTVSGVARFWEPEQSHAPSGEMRFGAVSRFSQSRDTPAGLARTDWVRDYEYPARRTYSYS